MRDGDLSKVVRSTVLTEELVAFLGRKDVFKEIEEWEKEVCVDDTDRVWRGAMMSFSLGQEEEVLKMAARVIQRAPLVQEQVLSSIQTSSALVQTCRNCVPSAAWTGYDFIVTASFLQAGDAAVPHIVQKGFDTLHDTHMCEEERYFLLRDLVPVMLSLEPKQVNSVLLAVKEAAKEENLVYAFELVCRFAQPLIQGCPASLPLFLDLCFQGMQAQYVLTIHRKRASYILEVLSRLTDFAFLRTYLDLQSSIDEFQLHLVEDIWPKLISFSRSAQDPQSPLRRWVCLLLSSALDNTNPNVRKFALEWILQLPSEELYCIADPAFALGTVQTKMQSVVWFRSIRQADEDNASRFTRFFTRCLEVVDEPSCFLTRFIDQLHDSESKSTILAIQCAVLEQNPHMCAQVMSQKYIAKLRSILAQHVQQSSPMTKTQSRCSILRGTLAHWTKAYSALAPLFFSIPDDEVLQEPYYSLVSNCIDKTKLFDETMASLATVQSPADPSEIRCLGYFIALLGKDRASSLQNIPTQVVFWLLEHGLDLYRERLFFSESTFIALSHDEQCIAIKYYTAPFLWKQELKQKVLRGSLDLTSLELVHAACFGTRWTASEAQSLFSMLIGAPPDRSLFDAWWKCMSVLLSTYPQIVDQPKRMLALSIDGLSRANQTSLNAVIRCIDLTLPNAILAPAFDFTLWQDSIEDIITVLPDQHDYADKLVFLCVHPALFQAKEVHDHDRHFHMGSIIRKLVEIGRFHYRVLEQTVVHTIPQFTLSPHYAYQYASFLVEVCCSFKADNGILAEHVKVYESIPGAPIEIHRIFARMMAVTFVDEMMASPSLNQSLFGRSMVEATLQWIRSNESDELVTFHASLPFLRVFYGWQLLSLLIPAMHEPESVLESILTTLQQGLPSQLRQVVEAVAVELCSANTVCLEMVVSMLENKMSLRDTVQMSLLYIAAFSTHRHLCGAGIPPHLLERTLFIISAKMTNNIGHIRTTAQAFFRKLILESNGDVNALFKTMFDTLTRDSKTVRLSDKLWTMMSQADSTSLCSLKGILDMNRNKGNCYANPVMDRIKPVIAEHLSSLRRLLDDVEADVVPIDVPASSLVSSIDSFQRKILPLEEYYASLFGQHVDRMRDVLQSTQERAQARVPLILFASLLSKAPNLGGLARTCEIFQASKLVVSDKRVLESKQFRALSVTAEQWLPVDEVPNTDMGRMIMYLRNLKSQGYAIIALEQTSNSTSLHEFKFPSNVVLLLGKEKEGVPIQLLQECDHFIEIPQFGLIRSLNVHVSASLFIWEYTRQRRFDLL